MPGVATFDTISGWGISNTDSDILNFILGHLYIDKYHTWASHSISHVCKYIHEYKPGLRAYCLSWMK